MTYNWMQLKKDNNDNRDLKIKVFWQFPPTANQPRGHVTSDPLPSGLRIEVHDHALKASDLLQEFLHPTTSQSHVLEDMLLFN